MKAKYTFPIKSNSRTDIGVSFTHQEWEYELKEEGGELTKISITLPNFPIEALPSISSTPDLEIKMSISIPTDPFIDDVFSKIRTIEGSLSFWGVDEINTEEYEREWIAENETEKSLLQMFSYKTNFHEPPIKDRPTTHLDLVIRSIISTEKFEPFEIALNFNRRGKIDFKSGKYIEAIYDYFFFLEHLYSNGKFRSKELANQFENSKELVAFIEKTKNEIQIHEPDVKTNSELKKIINTTTQETIREIIKLRGFLHHHSRSNPNIWHPSKQKDFKGEAIFLMHLCHSISISKCITELFTNDCLTKFRDTIVVDAEKQRIRWPNLEKALEPTKSNPTHKNKYSYTQKRFNLSIPEIK